MVSENEKSISSAVWIVDAMTPLVLLRSELEKLSEKLGKNKLVIGDI